MTAALPKFTGLIDVNGNPLRADRKPASRLAQTPRSTYDGADTNAGNRRHWANADGLSAKEANSPTVRKKLRERARLEFDNGGNCKGAIETIGHDLVGTGPRLQLILPEGSPEDAASVIERKFRDWCDDPVVNFADKLRIMVESELRDGESFALFIENPAVEGPVKLDFRVIETEQVATSGFNPLATNAVDGIEFDANGNPARYHVLKEHPGDSVFNPAGGHTVVPASQVIHWFRASRAGQARGIPRITPGLPLIAQIRGYASATLAAARLAAQYAGFISTNLTPDSGPVAVAQYDEVPVEDGMALTLPAGWEFTQVKPEHPGSTNKEFTESRLTEFGRSIHCPKNIVTGDSSNMNFSSSRLDRLMYQGAMRIDRNRLSVRVTDRVFKKWAEWAILTPGYLPVEIVLALPPIETWTWAWQFDGFPSINPADDSQANATNLENGLVTHGELLNERGVSWRDHFKSLAEQRAYARELGIEDLLYPWLAKAVATPVAPQPPRTNEGTRGQPQQRGAEYQAEIDTVLEEEVALA